MDRAPNGGTLWPLRCGPAWQLLHLAEASHILDRHFNSQHQFLGLACIHDCDGAIGRSGIRFSVGGKTSFRFRGLRERIVLWHLCRCSVGTSEVVSNLLERTLCCREADALQPAATDSLQAFERKSQVGSALGGDERVDLVDDYRIHGAQARRRVGRQQKVK